MALATPTIYNIVKSLEGNLLGLDNTKAPPLAPGGAATPLGDYAPFLIGRDFQGMRLFPVGQFGLQGSDYKVGTPALRNDVFDDFLGAAVSNFWNAVHGSDAGATVAITAANNGMLRLTSGAGSTHTMAVNGAQICGALNMLISDAGSRMETRLGNLSAATSQSFCFGLIDVATLSAPFTISGGTVTATAANAAAFVQDAAGTNTALNAVAINASGTPQVVALSNTIGGAAVFNRYRVEISDSGTATFFIDGVLVATIALAVATTAVLTPSVGMFSEATSGSQHVDVDYILGQNNRV